MAHDLTFEDRLYRIALEMHGLADPAEPQSVGTTRRDRLARALTRLKEGGITGRRAYPTSFRLLCRMGIVLAPMHYWPAPAIMFASTVFFAMLGTFVALVFLSLGLLPAPVLALFSGGPAGFLAVNVALAALVTATHRMEAARADLPRWSSF